MLADRPLVWITGAGGLIGRELSATAHHSPTFNARPLTRLDLDLLDPSAIERLFQRENPALIIHCAAVSKSPVCEADPGLARKINVEATRHLVDLAENTPILFFSTDLVFDGTKGDYSEEDPPNPLSTYAETKCRAEEIVRAHRSHIIVRNSLTGGQSPTGDRGFNEEMKNAWRSGKKLTLFTDEFRCPLAAGVVARAVWELAPLIIAHSARNVTGTFHLCGAEKLSRYDIGRLLAERHADLNPTLSPASRREYQGPPRPADTSLNCSKIQRLLSFPLPRFSEWLARDTSGF